MSTNLFKMPPSNAGGLGNCNISGRKVLIRSNSAHENFDARQVKGRRSKPPGESFKTPQSKRLKHIALDKR